MRARAGTVLRRVASAQSGLGAEAVASWRACVPVLALSASKEERQARSIRLARTHTHTHVCCCARQGVWLCTRAHPGPIGASINCQPPPPASQDAMHWPALTACFDCLLEQSARPRLPRPTRLPLTQETGAKVRKRAGPVKGDGVRQGPRHTSTGPPQDPLLTSGPCIPSLRRPLPWPL